MEYSKDIVLGVKFFNGEDKHENLKLEGIRENKYDKVKNKTGNLQKVQPMRQNVRRNVNKLYFPLFCSQCSTWNIRQQKKEPPIKRKLFGFFLMRTISRP